MTDDTKSIGVIGAGSWGTALAIQSARCGNPTALWGKDGEALASMQAARENTKYLPEVAFPAQLNVETDLAELCRRHADLLLATPSHALREIVKVLAHHPKPGRRVALAAKGLDSKTGKLPHEVVAEELGEDTPIVVLSGPTFAGEVGRDLPTAITIAGEPAWARELADRLHSTNFRPYLSTDVVGVEIGGAVKNVIAIGAGISDGLGFGANARVALITRGLAEIMRLGAALGGEPETFMGLAGMGDLVLTCTDDQSRNRRMGLRLAAGMDPEAAQRDIGQVVEGVAAAREVFALAKRHAIEMPITEQVYRVLHEGRRPHEAVHALLARDLTSE